MTPPDLGTEKFVSLTTYRRDGTPVATPLWAVRDGDALVMWTPANTGKIKRLRREARVELAACSRRGAVDADATRVPGRAEIVTGQTARAHVEELLKSKYGFQYRIVTLLERVVPRFRHTERVVVRITAVDGTA